MDSASPFAAILAGQPTLNRQLRMGMFAALDQRIATRFTIKPMDLAESAAYLRHHLKLAGREEPLFADDAIARLHRVSNGLPTALNNAAVAALIAAAAAGKDLADDPCAQQAAGHRPPPPAPRPPPPPPARHHQALPEREHRILPAHVQTAWPLTPRARRRGFPAAFRPPAFAS